MYNTDGVQLFIKSRVYNAFRTVQYEIAVLVHWLIRRSLPPKFSNFRRIVIHAIYYHLLNVNTFE